MKTRRRTKKEDRELCEKIAKRNGHELGAWDTWFCEPRAIAYCKLCGLWAGLKTKRDWVYIPNSYFGHLSGIDGSIIEKDYKESHERCWGIRQRGHTRSVWTKRYNKIKRLLRRKDPAKAITEMTMGEYPKD